MNIFRDKVIKLRKGYLCVGHIPIHRMIWEHLYGTIPEGHQIHHKDGNKLNNSVKNLECLSKSDHMHLHATMRSQELSSRMKSRSNELHEWHRSEKGRKTMGARAKLQFENREDKSYTCQHCSRTFTSKHTTDVKYCSDNCVMKARRSSGVDNEERACEICSNKFVINRYQKTRVCSMSCRNALLSHIKTKLK